MILHVTWCNLCSREFHDAWTCNNHATSKEHCKKLKNWIWKFGSEPGAPIDLEIRQPAIVGDRPPTPASNPQDGAGVAVADLEDRLEGSPFGQDRVMGYHQITVHQMPPSPTYSETCTSWKRINKLPIRMLCSARWLSSGSTRLAWAWPGVAWLGLALFTQISTRPGSVLLGL